MTFVLVYTFYYWCKPEDTAAPLYMSVGIIALCLATSFESLVLWLVLYGWQNARKTQFWKSIRVTNTFDVTNFS